MSHHFIHKNITQPFSERFQQAYWWQAMSCAILYITGGEYAHDKRDGPNRFWNMTVRLPKTARAIWDIKDVMFGEVDDRLDNMPPEKILTLGEATPGTMASPFLSNPLVTTEKDWACARRLIKDGFYSEADLMIISNLMMGTVVEGAKIAIALKKDPTNPELRQQATEQHMRSADISGFLLAHTTRKRSLKDTDFSYEQVAALYPYAAKISRVIEYYDDLIDLFKDYEHEKSTGIPNPNPILTDFYTLISTMDPEEKQQELSKFHQFMDHAVESNKPVSFSDFPPVLQQAVYATIKKSEQIVTDIRNENPTLPREIAYNLSIDMIGSFLKTGWPASMLIDKNSLPYHAR